MKNFNNKFNSANFIANPFVVETKTSKSRVSTGGGRWTYPYMYNRVIHNFARRQETLADRLRYWLDKHGTDGKPMSVGMFANYVNAYSIRYGYTFSMPLIYQYLNKVCSPKIDRCVMLANAMGIPVQWLMGYGPRMVQMNANYALINELVAQKKMNRQIAIRKATETRMAKRAKKNTFQGQEAA